MLRFMAVGVCLGGQVDALGGGRRRRPGVELWSGVGGERGRRWRGDGRLAAPASILSDHGLKVSDAALEAFETEKVPRSMTT